MKNHRDPKGRCISYWRTEAPIDGFRQMNCKLLRRKADFHISRNQAPKCCYRYQPIVVAMLIPQGYCCSKIAQRGKDEIGMLPAQSELWLHKEKLHIIPVATIVEPTKRTCCCKLIWLHPAKQWTPKFLVISSSP